MLDIHTFTAAIGLAMRVEMFVFRIVLLAGSSQCSAYNLVDILFLSVLSFPDFNYIHHHGYYKAQ